MCPAEDAKPAEPGSESGQQSRESAPPLSLLVLRSEAPMPDVVHRRLREMLEPLAEQIGAKAMVIESPLSVELHRDLGPLIQAIEANTAATLRVVEQNAALMQALAESKDEGEEPVTYLSGKRR